MRVKNFVVAFFLLCASAAFSQDRVQFPSAENGNVDAVLTKPADISKAAPAVILLHHGGGWLNTQTTQYAAILSKHGYVTLELMLFRDGSTASPRPSVYVPHVYGALKYLSSQSFIDGKRIALSGGSYGGTLALLSASEWAEQAYGAGQRFAAVAPFYPVCYFISWFNANKPATPGIPSTVYARYGHAPIRIYAAANDDYDDRDANACPNMVKNLPDEQQSKFTVKVFDNATHGWDQESKEFYAKLACKGKGCINRNIGNAVVTSEAIADLLQFLNGMPK
jgi:dienelactone hydrolase